MKRSTALLILALLGATAGAAPAAHFVISPGGQNLVKFTSKAPMETVEGKTRQASGSIDANLDNLGDSVRVEIEVDLASLDTGIDMRNKHMRENHLETSKYPKVAFHGRTVLQPTQTSLAPGQKVSFQCEGAFDLHGVTRTIQIPVSVTRNQDGAKSSLHIEASFPVKLADYKIPRPQFLVMRLDETQVITVDLTAQEQP
jgi:polyisoprenoid-binding protein YceI